MPTTERYYPVIEITWDKRRHSTSPSSALPSCRRRRATLLARAARSADRALAAADRLDNSVLLRPCALPTRHGRPARLRPARCLIIGLRAETRRGRWDRGAGPPAGGIPRCRHHLRPGSGIFGLPPASDGKARRLGPYIDRAAAGGTQRSRRDQPLSSPPRRRHESQPRHALHLGRRPTPRAGS